MPLMFRKPIRFAASSASSTPMIALAAVVATLAVSGPIRAEHDLLDDFITGTDDQWERLDQIDTVCDKPAVFDASSGAYRIESGCPIPSDDDAFVAARWVGITDQIYSDGVMRVSAEHLGAQTTLWINLRTWGNERTGLAGYRFNVSGGGTLMSIWRMGRSSGEVMLASIATLQQMFKAGDSLNVEAGAVGSRLTLKIWKDGDPEPDTPQLITSDGIFSSGDLVIGISHEGAEATIGAIFDDIRYTTAAPGDVTGNGRVDIADLMAVLAAWGDCGNCREDVNGDRTVDYEDLAIVLAGWS